MNKPKILISIRPKWCEKIFNGEKTIEVRRSAPKINTPFEALVYCTKAKSIQEDGLYLLPNDRRLHFGCEDKDLGFVCCEGDFRNGMVIGSFVCDSTTRYNCDKDYAEYFVAGYIGAYMPFKEMCLTNKNLIEYGKGDALYGWHITEPKLFDRPRELGEFGTICKKYGDDDCGDCLYLRVRVCNDCDDCIDTWCGVGNIKPITRAPQSWIYVEEIE